MPITVAHVKALTIGDFTGTVTVFNSAGSTATANATDIVRPSDWNSGHNVTYSPAVSEIASLFSFGNGLGSSTNTNGITVSVAEIECWEPFPIPSAASTLFAPANGSWYFDPVLIDNQLESGRQNQFFACGAAFQGGAVFSATSTGSVSKYATFYNRLAAYTQGTGSGMSTLTRVWSTEVQYLFFQSLALTTGNTSGSISITNYASASFPAAWDTAGGVTYSTISTSGTTSTTASTLASTGANNAISGIANYFSGSRMDPIAFNSNLPAGQYWMAYGQSSSSSTTGTNYGAGTVFPVQSRLGLNEVAFQAWKVLGSSTSNSTTMAQLFHGNFATTSASAPQSVGTSDMRNGTSNVRMYWNFMELPQP